MIGETPNLASRLQSFANPGAVPDFREYAPPHRWAFRMPQSRTRRASRDGRSRYQPGRCWRRPKWRAVSKRSTRPG